MFLKEFTWDIHLRLDKRLAVRDRFADVALYRAHLAQLWTFHAAAESQWGDLLRTALADYPERRKTHLLAADVETLGGFYVLEGATLGGQYLLPVVARRLGLSDSQGASYLASYGPNVSSMWGKFVAAAETLCATPKSRDMAGKKAREAFLGLETWLCGDLH